MTFKHFTTFILLIACFAATAVAQPTLSSSLTPPGICSGDLFTYFPTSGTAGTTFSWSRLYTPGISSLPGSGTGAISEVLTNTTYMAMPVVYTYTLTAGSGSNIQDVTVIVQPSPVLSSPLTAVVCSGAPFIYTPLSLSPGVSYTWARDNTIGISNTSTVGTGGISETLIDTLAGPAYALYHYVLVVGSCMDTQTVTVTVKPLPAPMAIAGTDSVGIGHNVLFTDGTAGGSWSSTTGKASVATDGTVTGIAAGIDTIVYTVNNDCGSGAVRRHVVVYEYTTIVLEAQSNPTNVTLYPNPSCGTIAVETPSGGLLSLFSADGRLLKEYAIQAGTNTLSLPATLATGVYMARVKDSEGKTTTLRLAYLQE